MALHDVSSDQVARAAGFVSELEREGEPFVRQVTDGHFVRAVLDGTFPLDGIRFVHMNHYHLIMNDMANLNVYVAKARDEDEMLFFHFMAAEEKNHLDSLFLLDQALGLDLDDVRAFEPHSRCLASPSTALRERSGSRSSSTSRYGQAARSVRPRD